MQLRTPRLLSVIVSVFNEEQGIFVFNETLHQTISKVNVPFEVIYVNDGSYDKTKEILSTLAQQFGNNRVIHFSRNYGHEAAMLAGIDHAKGDVLVCMDSDLQHPPVKIKEMLELYSQGNEVVSCIRSSREDGGFINNMLSGMFYSLINRISPLKFHPNASDFFMISDRVASVLKVEFRERTRFLRGFVQSVGFQSTTLTFKAEARKMGESKYSFSKLFLLSFGAITSFSKAPLYLGLIVGLICSLFSIVVLVYSIVMKMMGEVPPGYTTLVVLVSALFAIQFFLIGIIGIYIGHLFEENKKRPIYIVEKIEEK